jgi:hypothetical protein
MQAYQRKHVLNGKPWTRLQRLNYLYSILMAKRARMDDGDARKDGIMLRRCRRLEHEIKKEEKLGVL